MLCLNIDFINTLHSIARGSDHRKTMYIILRHLYDISLLIVVYCQDNGNSIDGV